MSFLTLIGHHAEVRPGVAALKLSDGSVLTYRELFEAILGVRSWLCRSGYRGSTVAIDTPNDFDHVVCFIAALTSDCRVLPLYRRLHAKEKEALLAAVRPSLTLRERPRDHGPLSDPVSDGSGSVLHLTSGSYGARKVVVRPYGNLLDEALAVGQALEMSPEEVVLVTSPLAHSLGCGMMRSVLCAGATLALSAESGLSARVSGFRRLLGEGVTTIVGVPYIYELLLRGGRRFPLRPGTRCYAGGASLPTDLAQRWERSFPAPLRQEYGLGEGGITTFARWRDPPQSIGLPIPNVRLMLGDVDSAGIGELVVYRPSAPRRYLLVEDSPGTFQEDGGIRTGDLARVDGAGRFYLAGRKKAVINVAGLKVNPHEVELCLMTYPAVEDAVVVAEPDRITGERPVAFVQVAGKGPTEGECRRFLSQHLARYKVPKRIYLLRELPRTDSGKVDRRKLMGRRAV